jgi:hypothetical protein
VRFDLNRYRELHIQDKSLIFTQNEIETRGHTQGMWSEVASHGTQAVEHKELCFGPQSIHHKSEVRTTTESNRIETEAAGMSSEFRRRVKMLQRFYM